MIAPVTTHVTPGFRALPLPVVQLSLSAVLRCGQSFRWSTFPLAKNDTNLSGDLPSHEYRFCLRDRVVRLRQTTTTLYYRSEFSSSEVSNELEEKEDQTLAWIRDYFQLDVDLSLLYDQWSIRDPVVKKLRDRFGGIRMLRQDPFECLMSFICSSNNNITRITNMVNALCREFSPALLRLSPPDSTTDLSEAYHPFPTPSALSAPEVAQKLRALGFGYRAEFIQRTAQMLVETHGASAYTPGSSEPAELWLKTLREMSTADARDALLKFVGVGRKVADCVLLMSMDKTNVVPVDTHVHQIAVKHYGMSSSSSKTKMNMTPKLYEQVSTKLVATWGDYAGWAQSILFTSDLKAFSTTALEAPPSQTLSPSKRKRRSSPSTNPPSPAPSLNVTSEATEVTMMFTGDESLVDRVKRRRRNTQRR